jgi:hypothetical protein
MKNILLKFVLISSIFFAIQSEAAVTPLSVGIAPPVQFPPSDFTITGLRVSALWGHHRDLYGVDVGMLGNITDQTFTGLGVSGLFNYTKGTTTILGLQLAGLTNINTNKTEVYGVQAALGLNSNTAASSLVGVQLAAANLSPFMDIYGLQAGLYNRAKDVYGFQIGVVNVADNLHGIQIGLINFNTKGLIGVSPLLNIGF